MKPGTAVYSVFVSILLTHSDEWLKWMSTEHIPDQLKTGFFLTEENNEPPKIFELLTEEAGVRRFEVRCFAKSVEDIKAYRASTEANQLGAIYKNKFGLVTSNPIRSISFLLEKVAA